MWSFALIVFLFLHKVVLSAQTDSIAYTGLRVALLNPEIKKTDDVSVLSIRCSLANTGRMPLQLGKQTPVSQHNIVFEYDTLAMPRVLRGREALIRRAALEQNLALAPGEVKHNLTIQIPIQTAVGVQSNSSVDCPDLLIDTIFLVKYTKKKMLLRYTLRNKGRTTANLLGRPEQSGDGLTLRIYFVSGQKLTRGAILAGNVQISKGVETLDGLLPPGASIEGEAELSLKNRTRFSPNVLMEIDPLQTIFECDRTNNTRTLVVEF